MEYVIIDKDGCPIRHQADYSTIVYPSYEEAMKDFKDGYTLMPFDEYEGAL